MNWMFWIKQESLHTCKHSLWRPWSHAGDKKIKNLRTMLHPDWSRTLVLAFLIQTQTEITNLNGNDDFHKNKNNICFLLLIKAMLIDYKHCLQLRNWTWNLTDGTKNINQKHLNNVHYDAWCCILFEVKSPTSNIFLNSSNLCVSH